MSADEQLKKVVVIGAGTQLIPLRSSPSTNQHRPLGVVGLTTALRIQEVGKYNCTIVAEVLPSDPKTIKYTSHWAVNISHSIAVSRIS